MPTPSVTPRPRFPVPALGLLLVGVGVAGVLAWLLLGGVAEPPHGIDLPELSSAPRDGDPLTPVVPGLPDAAPVVPPPSFPAARAGGTSGAVEPGLRTPFGEDLSDPAHVKALLRKALAVPRDWGRAADLLAIHEGALDPDVLDALVHALGDPAQAARAAGAWARVRDPEALDALLPRVAGARDDLPTWTAVLRAMTSAAAVPGADRASAVATLRTLIDGTPQDEAVLRTIARIGGPEALDAFIALATRPEGPVRIPDVVRADLDLRQHPDAGRRLAEALADRNASPEALVALADLAFVGPGAEAVVPALLALDAQGRPAVLRAAAYAALARVGDDRGYERLLAVAQQGDDPAAASDAARALASASGATPAARARLVEAARTTTSDDLRVSLVSGLGSLREPSALPLLEEWIGSGSAAVRSSSVAALAKYGPRAADAVESLGQAYGSGNDALRSQVAVTLAAIGTPEARRLLEQVRASEPDPTVKKVVESALRNLEARRSP